MLVLFRKCTLMNLFAWVIAGSIWTAVWTQNVLFALMPAVLLIVYWTIADFRGVYLLLWATIPFALEIELPGGFSTNLPDEPLMVGFLIVSILLCAAHFKKIRTASFLRHPITILLGMHYGWMFVAWIHSESLLISTKFYLAKIWYAVTFYGMGGWLMRRTEHVLKWAWCVFVPLTLAIIITLVRHSVSGFDFAEANYIMQPYFRNHVDYACQIALFLPFLVWMCQSARRGSTRKYALTLAIVLFLLGIQFSYTRAAYLVVIAAMGYQWIIYYKLTKYIIAGSLISIFALLVFLQTKNKYLDYAPNYEHAVSHTRFDNLVEATYKLEDVSTMERVYRWVAGAFMVQNKPYLGFGPGCFYTYYKPHAVTRFRTYVSNNPEKSGIHCYYLMTAVEQGVMGALIFLGLCFYALLRGEDIYHRNPYPEEKAVIMASILSLVIILLLLIINDLIESDKVGPFFFFNLALLVNFDKRIVRERGGTARNADEMDI